jgi:hypothetical protein
MKSILQIAAFKYSGMPEAFITKAISRALQYLFFGFNPASLLRQQRMAGDSKTDTPLNF